LKKQRIRWTQSNSRRRQSQDQFPWEDSCVK
jgi:hypothetical protein